MSRSTNDILADKILAETGTGSEKYAAEQRLLQDYEDYAESRARVHALEKKYAEKEAEEERKRAGLSKEEYKGYKFLSGMAYLCIPVGLICLILGVYFAATDADSSLFVTGLVIMGISYCLEKVSGKKLNR